MNILKQLTNPKYKLFTRKIRDVQLSIWEQEFKVAKSRQVREGVRQDRDRAVNAVLNLDASVKDKAQEKELAEQKATLQDNIKRYEAQMKMIDDQINGVPAKGEDPGIQGIMENIASLVELKGMFKSYRDSI